MCKKADKIQRPTVFLADMAQEGLKELRDAAQGCPACMLAGRKELDKRPYRKSMPHDVLEWEYQVEREAFFRSFHGPDGRYDYVPEDSLK